MGMKDWMGGLLLAGTLSAFGSSGCARGSSATANPAANGAASQAAAEAASGRSGEHATAQTGRTAAGEWLGFDRNDFPGDAAMSTLRHTFAFTGYWLTNPPGESADTWVGKRAVLRAQGWGFLVLANGRLDAEILKAQKAGRKPAELGRQDAAAAVASARREGFPAHSILFLDQEEGGRLLAEQAGYLLGWTEAVASAGFRPGVYASGQMVEDSPGAKIDTVQDVRARVAQGRLHPVAIFDAQDACPPAPGCTVEARPLHTAGEPDLIAWQFAQSPRRPEITKSCAATYAADGNCYAPGVPQIFLDMDVASSPDPSDGR